MILNLPIFIIHEITSYLIFAEHKCNYSLLFLYLLERKRRYPKAKPYKYIQYSQDLIFHDQTLYSTKIGQTGDFRSYLHFEKFLDRTTVLTAASASGQLDLIKFIMSFGQCNLKAIAHWRFSHPIIYGEISEKTLAIFNKPILEIYSEVLNGNGGENILCSYLENTARDCHKMALSAAYSGHIHILKYLADDLKIYCFNLNSVVSKFHEDFYFKACFQSSSNYSIKQVVQSAARRNGNIECVKFLMQFYSGPCDFETPDSTILTFLAKNSNQKPYAINPADEFAAVCATNNVIAIERLLAHVKPEIALPIACISANEHAINLIRQPYFICSNCGSDHLTNDNSTWLSEHIKNLASEYPDD